MRYGIYDLKEVAPNEDIVLCNNCDTYFYDEITDERNCNSLEFLWDKKERIFFKGCPLCKTDNYLIDISPNF